MNKKKQNLVKKMNNLVLKLFSWKVKDKKLIILEFRLLLYYLYNRCLNVNPKFLIKLRLIFEFYFH